MEREIKFRGLPFGKGLGWQYGYLIKQMYRGKEKFYVGYVQNGVIMGIEVDPYTIGQYMELKDSTGKEIYEGDIVTIGLCTALVTWNEELATFALQFDFEDKVGRKPLGEWEDVIVIGNIHENPELIKGNKI